VVSSVASRHRQCAWCWRLKHQDGRPHGRPLADLSRIGYSHGACTECKGTLGSNRSRPMWERYPLGLSRLQPVSAGGKREPMKDFLLILIRPDMDVFGSNGEAIGTVARVHFPSLEVVREAADRPTPGEGVLEVKTGLFGLGKRIYVPAPAILDVTQEGVIISATRDASTDLAWQMRPAFLGEESVEAEDSGAG
jgi:hypothetical protein